MMHSGSEWTGDLDKKGAGTTTGIRCPLTGHMSEISLDTCINLCSMLSVNGLFAILYEPHPLQKLSALAGDAF